VKRLIVHGDPGVRKDGEITVEGQDYVCFSVTRNGDWHGPAEVQLWCVVGSDEERDRFASREYVPHFLDTERVDADAVEVTKRGGDQVVY
jgi:hypothetical protein